jgi:hypothetical protein
MIYDKTLSSILWQQMRLLMDQYYMAIVQTKFLLSAAEHRAAQDDSSIICIEICVSLILKDLLNLKTVVHVARVPCSTVEDRDLVWSVEVI